jgi:hypothetical protein
VLGWPVPTAEIDVLLGACAVGVTLLCTVCARNGIIA